MRITTVLRDTGTLDADVLLEDPKMYEKKAVSLVPPPTKGTVSDSSDVHPKNAPCAIDVTLPGIIISEIDEQPANAWEPIDVALVTTTLVSLAGTADAFPEEPLAPKM